MWMIFYKVILYGVNFVLPHSMSAKNEIKVLLFTAASSKNLQFLTYFFRRFLLTGWFQFPRQKHAFRDGSPEPCSTNGAVPWRMSLAELGITQGFGFRGWEPQAWVGRVGTAMVSRIVGCFCSCSMRKDEEAIQLSPSRARSWVLCWVWEPELALSWFSA